MRDYIEVLKPRPGPERSPFLLRCADKVPRDREGRSALRCIAGFGRRILVRGVVVEHLLGGQNETSCMSVLAGRWTGQISGTNVGSFVLDMEVDGDALTGTFALQDFNHGAFIYDTTGTADQNRVHLSLTPRVYPRGAEVGSVEAEGVIQEDGSCPASLLS